MQEQATRILKWKREEEGSHIDTTGEFTIDKHEVDDREYDGGECATQWFLYSYGYGIAVHYRLKDAKREAQYLVSRRDAHS